MEKKLLIVATALVSGLAVGCGGDSAGTDTAATTSGPAPAGMAPAGSPMAPTATTGAQPATGAGTQTAGAGKGAANSWDTVSRRLAGFSLAAGGAQGGAATGKPAEVAQGVAAPGFRVDPFESFVKVVVPEVAAYTLALPRRLASEYRPAPPKIENLDPNLYKGPLPPVPRRVAGVMYNGAITAILETGEASGNVRHDVIRPGSVIPFGLDGQPDLLVESITMTSLVLRAPDGRTVEVKLSGLPPAVADALRSQFGNPTGGAATPGMGGGGMMPGAGGGGGGGGSKESL